MDTFFHIVDSVYIFLSFLRLILTTKLVSYLNFDCIILQGYPCSYTKHLLSVTYFINGIYIYGVWWEWGWL